MMMQKLHTHKRYIVVLLLTGFIGVFVCDILCDAGVISWGGGTAHAGVADHHKEAHHPHDSQTDHHHNTIHDHHDSPEKDECCQDLVNQVYASLIKYELKQHALQLPVFYCIYEAYTVLHEPKMYPQQTLSFLYTNLPPPVSGFHLRVFIQSFLH